MMAPRPSRIPSEKMQAYTSWRLGVWGEWMADVYACRHCSEARFMGLGQAAVAQL